MATTKDNTAADKGKQSSEPYRAGTMASQGEDLAENNRGAHQGGGKKMAMEGGTALVSTPKRLSQKQQKNAANASSDRNRRKKENLKRRKAEEKQKETEEAELLNSMMAMALEERDQQSLTDSRLEDWLAEATEEIDALGAGAGNKHIVGNGDFDGDHHDEPKDGKLFKIKPSPGKGQGLFATEFIKKNTVIFLERPLLNAGPDWLEKEALLALLPEQKKRALMGLHSYCTCQKTPCEETSLMKIYNINAFGEDDAGQDRVSAVYEIASRMNHACIPNTAGAFSGPRAGTVILVSALEDILAGEELTINYLGTAALPTAERQQILLRRYGFVCGCDGCMSDQILPEDALKSKPELDRTNWEILGERSTAELAACDKAFRWYQRVLFHLQEGDRAVKALILDDLERRDGVNNTKTYMQVFEMRTKDFFQLHNDCGLSDDVIQRYLDRTFRVRAEKFDRFHRSIKTMEVEELDAVAAYVDERVKGEFIMEALTLLKPSR